jgi:hypothetical protein
MGLFSGKSQRIAYMDVQKQLHDIAKANNDNLNGARKRSLKELDRNYDKARDSYGTGIDRFQPFADTGLKALEQYSDAVGMNGAEGHDRAVASFRAGPGYEWQVDQATDAVARKASSLGALGSGNTMAAITDRASNLADQEYDGYLSNLKGLTDLGYSATGAQAGLDQGIGNLYVGEAQDKTGLETNIAGMKVGNRWQGALPTAQYRMGISNAGSQASANAWGLGMNLAKLGLGFAGGMGA